jgi:hypothetical protein
MPIAVVWDDAAQTILRYDIGAAWTWDDLRGARAEVFTRMDQSPAARIGAIIHFMETARIPGDATSHLRDLSDRSHPKAALTVIVGANRLMKTAFTGFKRVAALAGKRVDFAYADTLDQARTLIRRDLAGR